tara:strand:- start:1519 stop:2127 length:609 start_codon:yes stop_codon:yes gene_type:complete
MATVAEKQTIKKEQVARVTWRLLAKNGYESASMREIAQALGTTTGTLTHYFRDKEDMIQYTYEYMYSFVRERVDSAHAEGPASSRLWRCIETLLPIKKPHLDNHKVWLSFITTSFGKISVKRRNKKAIQHHREILLELVENDRANRKQKPAMTSADETDLLICITEALATLAAIDEKTYSPERTRHLAKVAFEKIIGRKASA